MRHSTIIDVDGVLHMVWSLRHVGTTFIVTYCDLTVKYKLEAQTSLMTCVACIAGRARDMALLREAMRHGYVNTMPDARRRHLK